jgi:predicted ArsR family transcriptional regulator
MISQRSSWGFLTNHAQVLHCIVRDPSVRLRDVAMSVGITERAAQSIVADLVADGYLSRRRVGRRNQYDVHVEQPLRHADGDHSLSVGEFLEFLGTSARTIAFATGQSSMRIDA